MGLDDQLVAIDPEIAQPLDIGGIFGPQLARIVKDGRLSQVRKDAGLGEHIVPFVPVAGRIGPVVKPGEAEEQLRVQRSELVKIQVVCGYSPVNRLAREGTQLGAVIWQLEKPIPSCTSRSITGVFIQGAPRARMVS